MAEEQINIFFKVIDQATKPIRDMANGLKQVGTYMTKHTQLVNNFGSSLKHGRGAIKIFNMELLSVMFFGQMLSKTFLSMAKPAAEAFGIFELWGQTLQVLFLPLMSDLTPHFVKLTTSFMNLPEPIQKVISIILIMIGIFGAVMAVVASVGLFLGLTLGAPFILIVAGITAAVIGLVLLFTTFGKDIGDFFKNLFLNIGDFVYKIVDKITSIIDDLLTFITGVGKKVFDAIFGGLGTAKDWVFENILHIKPETTDVGTIRDDVNGIKMGTTSSGVQSVVVNNNISANGDESVKRVVDSVMKTTTNDLLRVVGIR
jgi:hypothetical protein